MELLLSAVSYLWATWPLSLLKRPPPYEYAPLEEPRQIRLLDFLPRKGGYLRCKVEVVDLDNAPPFTALSYTHGFPLDGDASDHEQYDRIPLIPLLCEGKELLIKPNLASALWRFDQLGKHGYCWIDQVCINQQDEGEVGTQVEMMGDIYWIAQRVLVWLGWEAWDFEVFMKLMEELLPKFEDLVKREGDKSDNSFHSFTNPQIYSRLGTEVIPDYIWNGLAEFLERRWFSRAWTLQEILLPRDIDIYCGATKISWKSLSAFLKHLQMSDWQDLLSWNNRYANRHSNLIPGNSTISTMKLRQLIFKRDPSYQIYLGNIAGGSDNMDLTIGYIDHLIYAIRSRSATDPRDKFFALYGIISRLCDIAEPKLPNPLIRPDYTKSIAEVYIANTKSLLAHSKSLLMLSNVDDRSLRKRTDLPSWVPDMTVAVPTALARHATGDIFNTSRRAVPELLPASNQETLRLFGYWIDTVTDLGDDDTSAGIRGGPFEKSAALLLKMPKFYIRTGQDRVEVFWRTLIADFDAGGACPATGALGESFHEHLLMHNSMFLLRAQKRGEQAYQAAMQCMKPLTTLAASTDLAASLIPSFGETLQRKDVYISIGEAMEKRADSELHALPNDEDARTEATRQKVLCEEAKATPFARQSSTVFAVRRIFRTAGNLLGLGPKSLRPGDHIFVLLGARVPFILRPIAPAEDGRSSSAYYEMVGEAYVHGIMQGEALQRGQLEKIKISLI
ncbi:hypothetical protein EPUS_06474 [Endocarpon pusillum Z07020]|uniref:Heterokaryon incompatibility domain-containing protein n=1 Tax=Endocarpon pusillum (strain Z07020 / HMAS-L-300199) TaxID=1263415 RepID=U1I4Z2_ENDPU|nr:uncharacterized protein EPUS_06474 [Endocarpon pusillum Z07020]ERF77194.1 hypothetical protein EPUS_06474 [Endocarpon pusillum Z07020]